MTDAVEGANEPASPVTGWRLLSWVCCAVVAVSLVTCLVIAAARSEGLTQVTVTALDGEAEPRDHQLPFVKQVDALPDYELVVRLHRGGFLQSGGQRSLGARPNQSAVDGITWTLNDPIPISEIAGIRLQEQDKVISDALTEVQVVGSGRVEEGNWRFDFETQRSAAIGVEAFFATPIGKAISAAFVIAILLMLLPVMV
ncbi:hypothetical protein Mal4_34210 [Maioricimonas rarisocia]|uniref:Uncharacterized protein n=1 Tax=Maioricimonas rarisocia TaxID=2528026 RepID=A0A517Z9D5_9PLAN|nr:hypothetical protein [Maioricimonas rarisocia]QDU39086.1 hypothetical protein Mal4_34210 [Maioricimonas rarisocia]